MLANRVRMKLGMKKDDTSGSPGSAKLIAGDMQAGYFGEVSMQELITGDSLASRVGLTAGTSQFSSTSGWLKFAYKGKILFVAKKPLRYQIAWSQLNTASVVTGKQIAINGKNYKVRLLSGSTSNPTQSGQEAASFRNSEWNSLMIPIHVKSKTKQWSWPSYVNSDVPSWGIDFTDADLHVGQDSAQLKGAETICQENYLSSIYVITRGPYSIEEGGNVNYDNAYYFGWRPVLELI